MGRPLTTTHFGALCLVVLIGFLSSPLEASSLKSEPDPIALLRGVQSSREAIGTGKAHMTITIEKPKSPKDSDRIGLEVVFDGIRRTARESKSIMEVVASSSGDNEEAHNRLAAYNNDRNRMVREGLGKWSDETVRSAWDGNNFGQYNRANGANFRDHTRGSDQFVFDPRLLGLLENYFVDRTAEIALGLHQKLTRQTIGKEQLRGLSTWRVLVNWDVDATSEFWIEDREGFRVHKLVHQNPTARYEVDSEFDGKDASALLPRKVVGKEFGRNGEHLRTVTIVVDKLSLNVPVDPNVGTLGSLEIPKGIPVSDQRIGRRVGYWNGSRTVPELEDALKRSESDSEGDPKEIERFNWKTIGVTTSVAVVVIGLLWWVKRGSRNAM